MVTAHHSTPGGARAAPLETVERPGRASSLGPLARPADLAARVARALRVAIVGGELAADERLVPERIADAMNVSRPLVRTALGQIEREGLVTIGANGRPRVVRPSPAYVRDLYRFRFLLDQEVVTVALGRVPAEAEASLREMTEAMVVQAAEGALEPFAELDLAFHDAFLTLAGNPFVLGAWQGISDVARAFLVVTDRLFPVLPRLAVQHQEILRGLCSGDEVTTLAALRQHYVVGLDLLSTPMARTGAPERGTP